MNPKIVAALPRNKSQLLMSFYPRETIQVLYPTIILYGQAQVSKPDLVKGLQFCSLLYISYARGNGCPGVQQTQWEIFLYKINIFVHTLIQQLS